MNRMAGRIEVADWGLLPDGRMASLITLTYPDGHRFVVSDLGGIVTEIRVPTRSADFQNMVLDLPTPAEYLAARCYLGAIAGRFANRIEAGRFLVDGVAHQLATNDHPGDIPCHLHGGQEGFDRKLWRAEPFTEGETLGVRLEYTSPAGEENYPGELHATTTYRWTEDGTWEIEYVATTTAPTMVNLTQHSYFDLGAARTGHARDLHLRVDAEAYTPVGADMIPRGEIAPLHGTPLDMRRTTRLGDLYQSPDPKEQLILGGLDHNYVLNGTPGQMRSVAWLTNPVSGVAMTMSTDQAGLQVYSSVMLDCAPWRKYDGVCLEAQNFPNAPNVPAFPSACLRPGQVYLHRTEYAFRPLD